MNNYSDFINKYDLFSPQFKANPFPTFAQMREVDPIYPHHAPKGEVQWYITRYDDVLAVLKDSAHFVKDQRNIAADEASGPSNRTSNFAINQNMLFADPPEHTQLRALVNQAFTSRRVSQMQPQIETVADTLLTAMMRQNPADLVAAYAMPLPIIVICDMLGIPAEDQDEICDLSQAIISPGRQRLNFSTRRRRVRQFLDYIRQLVTERRNTPQDDLVTALVQAEVDGARLSEESLSSMVALLLVTGHETTADMIGNAVLALLQHPDQLALLSANTALMEPAIEELLRFDGCIETSTTRWVKDDAEFKGHLMHRGDIVRVVIASANRDPAVFADPDRLDIQRPDNRHLTFGQATHYCLGAPLARLEMKVALSMLLDRLPGLRLTIPAEDLVWRSGVVFRGLTALPVEWE